jgi:hypothetical protein
VTTAAAPRAVAVVVPEAAVADRAPGAQVVGAAPMAVLTAVQGAAPTDVRVAVQMIAQAVEPTVALGAIGTSAAAATARVATTA